MAVFILSKVRSIPLVFSLFSRQVRHGSSYQRFRDQTAIVTGSSKSIGLACARRLAEEGAKVVISSRSKDNVEEALKQVHTYGLAANISGIVCDAGNADHRKLLIEHTLKLNQNNDIDIVVSNVANGSYRPLLTAKESSWDKMMDLNVKSHFQLIRECLPYMKRNKKGSVVFIGSLGAYLAYPEPGVYCVSKSCMLQLTKVLASELGNSNIRVNCVVPGLIETEMAGPSLANAEVMARSIKANNLMGRPGQPEEIAGPVAFLCSDDATYITGEAIVVSGYQSFTHL